MIYNASSGIKSDVFETLDEGICQFYIHAHCSLLTLISHYPGSMECILVAQWVIFINNNILHILEDILCFCFRNLVLSFFGSFSMFW
jgi:hypothetical protein